MDYEKLKKVILDMELDERKTIYKINENIEIFVNKPLKVPTKLKQSARYDPKKNFQIGLRKKGQKEFLPNHLRIMMDLQLKKDEDSKKAKILFEIIEDIFEGKDPLNYKEELNKIKFEKGFENSLTIVCLAQLFFLEQDINYHFGKVQPPRVYLMGYIRMIRLGIDEIDKMLWSSTRHPPRMEFRSKECLKQEKLS
ncbi:hypothetical protein KY332_00600 [Candidatus Woesearchaeota archaeon]|nr:hypothetical protein [Candidatus Woesearchaeota archaeon]